MKYVLDASVAIKWVIVEPDSNKATRMREDYRNAIHDLIAPESFAIECAYSLTKKQRQSFFRTRGRSGMTSCSTLRRLPNPLAGRSRRRLSGLGSVVQISTDHNQPRPPFPPPPPPRPTSSRTRKWRHGVSSLPALGLRLTAFFRRQIARRIS